MLAQFNVPSTLIVGGGASSEVGAQAKRLKAKRAFLVTDTYMVDSGLAGRMVDCLKGEGIETTVFADVQPDPTDDNVIQGLDRLKRADCDIVVALGGGSPTDAAKAIAVLVNNPPPIAQYAGLHNIPNAGIPLIVIPTTSGTGSEVTKVSIITDTERDVKMLMLDVNMLPTVALVDYELTMTMPASLTAHVGIDTLVHAVEAYVSQKANPLTDPIALSCIRLVSENLYTAFKEPDNRAAREAMMLASTQGGMAFSNSSVCLVHGMSRPIGALYHVPHGLSNAVLFPSVVEYSISGAQERYAAISRIMTYANAHDADEAACAALVDGLKELNQKLEVPSLSECVKVDRETFDGKVEKMAGDGLASGSPANNPVVPDVQEIVDLYHACW